MSGKWRVLWFYFLLAYAFSWLIAAPLALQGQGILSRVPPWLHLLSACGPLLAAVGVTAVFAGRAGLAELAGRVTCWRIGWLWWGVALLSPVVVWLAVAALVGLFSGDWVAFGRFGLVAELPGVGGLSGWLVWLFTFGLGEEVGWRGFALPRLQAIYSARAASLILGLLWAAWHIPFFFYNYEPALFGVVAFTVGILFGTALLTWLYNSTGGSVLATIVWHGTYNAVVAGAGGMVAAGVTAVVILAVILIARRYGPETLSHRPKQISPATPARAG